MAAVAQIDIEKSCDGEIFTNRYLVDIAPGHADAAGVISALVEAERALMYDVVDFVRARHSTLAPSDDVYTMTLLTGTGARGLASDWMLPLFNVVRVDFQPTAGRPSRKYLRGALAEGDVLGRFFIAGYIAAHSGPYITAVVGQAHVVDPQGDDLVSGLTWPQVAMRQLRRGSRRRTEPVLG